MIVHNKRQQQQARTSRIDDRTDSNGSIDHIVRRENTSPGPISFAKGALVEAAILFRFSTMRSCRFSAACCSTMKSLCLFCALLMMRHIIAVQSFITSFQHSTAAFRTTRARTRRDATLLLALHCSSSSSSSSTIIALTREEGKNDKLQKQLQSTLKDSVRIVELPCIAHADGEDFQKLQPTLQQQAFDYVIVTSPEAAKVLSGLWQSVYGDTTSSSSRPLVAVVGKATQQMCLSNNIPVDFLPSRALASVLVEELPMISSSSDSQPTVLYPCSTKAANVIQEGLSKRGFAVTRLNTYDTIVNKFSPQQQELASCTNIVCFGSPSAVHGWLENTNNNTILLATCIGETSAVACLQHGWDEQNILYPDKPGIDSWAEKVEEALCMLSR